MKKISLLVGTIGIISIVVSLLMVDVVYGLGSVVIAEIQTGSSTNASAEFVRLANITTLDVDLSGWKLQYKSAGGTVWVTKSTLQNSMVGNGQLLIATIGYTTSEAYQTMTDGLAQTGGHIQLIDKSGMVQDLLGWGTATHAEGLSAPAPTNGQTLKRLTDVSGNYIDTDNNLADFYISDLAISPIPSPVPVPPTPNLGLVTPTITELLPNPASPLTDDKDEFVELFNSNAVAFPLKSYKLQTGSSFVYSLTFDTEVLPPLGYLIFKSGTSALKLSNTSGTARLLDATGLVIDQTETYGVAGSGLAWALIDGSWQWTTTPTPLADNILTLPQSPLLAPSPKTPTPANSKVSAPTTAKSNTTAKVKSASTSAKPTATSKTGNSSSSNSTAPNTPSPLHPIILAGVGGLAVVYGVYEYRHDVANWFYKFRRYRTNRRESRKAV